MVGISRVSTSLSLSQYILHWILLCCYVLSGGRAWLTQKWSAAHVFCQHPTPEQTHVWSVDCRLSEWSQAILFSPYTTWLGQASSQIMHHILVAIFLCHLRSTHLLWQERTTKLQLSYDNRAPSLVVKAWNSHHPVQQAKTGERW